MKSFYQFWDKVNGEMYKNVPPPVQYNFQKMDYAAGNSADSDNSQFKPITDDEIARYGGQDVMLGYISHHNGNNPLRLGKPMTDFEFPKFYGQEWPTISQ